MYENCTGTFNVDIEAYNDPEKGYKNCLREIWRKANVLFNPNGPAVRVFRPGEKYNLLEEWRNAEGRLHREGKPACIQRFPHSLNASSFAMTQKWFENGINVREPESVFLQSDASGAIFAERRAHEDIACLINGGYDPEKHDSFPGKYRVTVEIFNDDGEYGYQNCLREAWQRHKIAFNPSGPAVRVFRPEERYNLFEEWYNEQGQLHREEKPARIIHFPHDLNAASYCMTQEWFLNGVATRENGPAFLETDENGTMTQEIWMLNGEEHRVGGPSYLSRQFHTFIDFMERWKQRGQLHREGGPAEIERDELNGMPSFHVWYYRDEPYREGGLPVYEGFNPYTGKLEETKSATEYIQYMRDELNI
jgi:hypothetical protein